jgi:putative tryptophan/tyrosine transport system substrate-binding protein
MGYMLRRAFITLLGGATIGWPLAAHAQQPRKPPTIGFLGQTTRVAQSPRLVPFLERLRELGWIEGQTVAIEYGWAEGMSERFAEIAGRFVQLKVDVIVTSGTPSVVAAKQATTVIPVVFAVAGDPIANNLVTSLSRPGGNITGLSTVATDLAGKRVELLREAVPDIQRLAILTNASNPLSVLETGEVEATAQKVGIKSITLGIRHTQDIAAAIGGLRGPADALYVVADPLTNTNRAQISPGGHDGESAGDLQREGAFGSRRFDCLWSQFRRPLSTRCQLRRPNSAWHQAG